MENLIPFTESELKSILIITENRINDLNRLIKKSDNFETTKVLVDEWQELTFVKIKTETNLILMQHGKL